MTDFLRKKPSIFMYLFINQNVAINTFTNIKLILCGKKKGFISFSLKMKILSLLNFLICLYAFYTEDCHSNNCHYH